MMDVVVTTAAIRRVNLQSNRHHQQTNTQLHTDRMSFLSPNQQCQSTEGKSITLHGSRSIAPRSIAPRSEAPLVLVTPVKRPLVKTPPPVKRPHPCQTILPVSGRERESMYSVYYVVIDTGIGAIFFEKNTHKEQHMVRE